MQAWDPDIAQEGATGKDDTRESSKTEQPDRE
jgi:hypothetical protein